MRGTRPDDPAPEFQEPEAAPQLKRKELSPPVQKREVTIDQASGERRLTILDDFGRYELPEHRLQIWECARESYSILPDDPLSAKQSIHWSEEMARGTMENKDGNLFRTNRHAQPLAHQRQARSL